MKRLALVVVGRARARVLAVALLLAGSLPTSFAASSFTGLGFLPGGSSSCAHAVSGDGKVVVGGGASGSSGRREAFRWTATDGILGLGFMGRFYSDASDVSGDGLVIVGYVADRSATGHPKAFRWTRDSGMVALDKVPDGHNATWARSVSCNGSVVVGECQGPAGLEAFRWTATTGMTCSGRFSYATAISGDGSVVVGSAVSGSVGQAARWTEAGGMVSLGCLREGWGTGATSVSADGAVVVGSAVSKGANRWEAFRWTKDGGMVGLGSLPGLTNSESCAVSKEGSIVLGVSYSYPRYEAFIWDTVFGVRSLQSVLTKDFGLDLTGWTLISASGISDDRTTIVGHGRHNDHYEAWIAHLDRPLNETGKAKGK